MPAEKQSGHSGIN